MTVVELQSQIRGLDHDDRLRMMEWLWELLSREAEAVESPSWHGEVIARRMGTIRDGEASFLSLDEVKERLHRE